MSQADDNDNALRDFLDSEDLGAIPDLNEINERELDLGEKANDAEDYGDISDEDLAEDETELKPLQHAAAQNDADDDAFADLFGDDAGSPQADLKEEDALSQAAEETGAESAEEEESEEEDAETKEQRLLFEQASRDREERLRRGGDELIPPPTTNDEVFYSVWPQFEPNRPPRFNELLPTKKAIYIGKTPTKIPRPVHPTKVNLNVEADQEKLFKTPAAPPQPFEQRLEEARARGLILIASRETEAESSEEEEVELLEEDEDLGGVSWSDLVAVCQDWDIPSDPGTEPELDADMGDVSEEDDFFGSPRPTKRQKLSHAGPLQQIYNINTSFDSPEKLTARLAKKVTLDLNDSRMLVDDRVPTSKTGTSFKRDTSGGLTKDFIRRYNISNDDAYDLLKQNHQNRVRAQLGNTPIEHSGPAVRLQYPFYKQALTRKEARSWHRPLLTTIAGPITLRKTVVQKRKLMRGRPAHEVFVKSRDLGVGDNSHVMLFEYSEENPPMLSSFGMGNRLINYYRRKDEEDTSRPKMDVGETSVLLPQDKSPFDIFGDVDRGQIVPTLSNAMYRAPIFKHPHGPTDFLLSRSTTGVDGPIWHMRNIEGLYVVGQEFPYQEVPGPKSRYSTNVAKARLQMVSYRMFNRNSGKLTMDMVRKHNPTTDVPTIRTKMREFMGFDKSAGQGRGIWVPKQIGEVPDEAGIRAMVKPEDVALLCAMQVGQQHLSDAGYHKQGEDEDEEDDEAKAGNIDRQLAPWNTTKNFLLSCTDKAMIQVHGEGDPTGRGEALSMIKTSMKGGFKAVGQSIEDRLDAQRQKDLGGHKYNVARQKQEYAEAIRRVWEAQAQSLSSTERRDDFEGVDETITDRRVPAAAPTRREDESASVLSRTSSLDQSSRVMRITRRIRDKYGQEEVVQEVIRDPNIIREYRRRRKMAELESLSLLRELDRLHRNVERRDVREKAKVAAAASPDGDSQDGDTPRRRTVGTTQRKCANCGQVGHIKTNKKLCSVCIYMSTPLHAAWSDSQRGKLLAGSFAATK